MKKDKFLTRFGISLLLIGVSLCVYGNYVASPYIFIYGVSFIFGSIVIYAIKETSLFAKKEKGK